MLAEGFSWRIYRPRIALFTEYEEAELGLLKDWLRKVGNDLAIGG